MTENLLFVRNDGLFAVSKIEGGELVQTQSGTNFSANWTHVVAVGSDLLFVRNDGLFAVAKIDAGQIIQTQSGTTAAPNWTHIVTSNLTSSSGIVLINVLRLFQVPVSSNTDEARKLQASLDRILPTAGQILEAAQNATVSGHAEIGSATGRLVRAFGKAQSTHEILSEAKNMQDKAVQHANSLADKAGRSKKTGRCGLE